MRLSPPLALSTSVESEPCAETSVAHVEGWPPAQHTKVTSESLAHRVTTRNKESTVVDIEPAPGKLVLISQGHGVVVDRSARGHRRPSIIIGGSRRPSTSSANPAVKSTYEIVKSSCPCGLCVSVSDDNDPA